MVRRILIAPVVALVLVAVAPSAAAASCAAPASLPEQIKAAALVFVGTVLSTSDQDRIAYVMVESIWKGPTLAENLKVFGSPLPDPNTATSVDRTYRAGTRYLFVLNSADQPYQDNSCSATQPYTPSVALLAPADARKPISVLYPTDPTPNRGQTELVVGLVLIALAATTGAIIAARTLRSRRR
jgi:hypothetical protein